MELGGKEGNVVGIGEYQITYEYIYENNIYKKCNVEIRRSNGDNISDKMMPEGWVTKAGGGTNLLAIGKTFETKTTENLGEYGFEGVSIVVDKIGEFVDRTKNHILKFEDKCLYRAVMRNQEVKDKIINKNDDNKTIEMTIENIEKIKNLQIWYQHIKDLTGIENFVKLETLDVSNNQIDNIDSAAKLTNLKQLKVKKNKIKNLPENMKLNNIEILDFSDNEIENITPITNQLKNFRKTNINTLDFSGNKIKDISSLQGISASKASVENQRITIISTESTYNSDLIIEFPQILKQAVEDGANFSTIKCEYSGTNIIIRKETYKNYDIGILIDSYKGAKPTWPATGTKITIYNENLPGITLYNEPAKDTVIKLNEENTCYLAMCTYETKIYDSYLRVKIGTDTILEGKYEEISQYSENGVRNILLGDENTSKLNGRITIEVLKTENQNSNVDFVVNTKYIVDNTPPNIWISDNSNIFEEGKNRITLGFGEPAYKLIEDGKEYELKWYEDNYTLDEDQDAGGWIYGRTFRSFNEIL